MLDNSNLFALLIDGDNVQTALIPQLLNKINEYGNPIIKNVYLNRSSLTKEWDEIINEHSLHPIWVPNNTPRKNAVDIAITIDAMELLYENSELYGFCIVSSDSDFTRLASRLVRKVKFVLGIGEDKTPKSFRAACSEFVNIKDILQPQAPVKEPKDIPVEDKEKTNYTNTSPIFETLFIQAYENISKETDGWVQLIEIKDEMNALDVEFQSSEYQYMRRYAEKVIALAESYPASIIEIDEKLDSKPIIHYIRIDYEMFKFIEAYKQVPDKEQGGWIQLSRIGDELSKVGSGFSYRGIQQPKKVVIKMSQDYPRMIKIREKMKGNKAIDVVRVKL